MSFKSESDIQTMIKAYTALGMGVEQFLDTTFLTRLEALKTAIEAGDPTPEDAEMERTFRQIGTSAASLLETIYESMRASYAALGRFAGAPALGDSQRNLDEFHQWLLDNADNIASRDFNYPASTPLTAGAGEGRLGVFHTDIEGEDIDVSHLETLKIRCIRGADQEVTPGREMFTAEGRVADYPWREDGSGIGQAYDYPYGNVPSDFAAEQQKQQTGGIIQSISGSQASGNLLVNGDFDQPISGTGASKLPNWTFSSGDSNVIQSPTSLNGVNSIRASGAALLYQDIVARPTNGTLLGLGVKVKVNGTGGDGVTGTVTVRIKSRDGSSTYGTLTHNIATTEPNLGNVLISTPALVTLPVDAPELRVEVETSALGGTATGKSLDIVDVCLGPTTLIDGKALFIYSGDHLDSNGNRIGAFKRGDVFEIETTGGISGMIQKHYVNRASGRYLAHDSTASTGWEDPTPASVLTLSRGGTPIAHEATDALGNVETGSATSFTYVLQNTGDEVLGVTGLALANDSNVTGSLTEDSPWILYPGQSVSFVVELEPTTAAGFSIDLLIANTFNTEFEIEISGTGVSP